MDHVNGWCFRGMYKGGLWEDDLHVSAHQIYDYSYVWKLVDLFDQCIACYNVYIQSDK